MFSQRVALVARPLSARLAFRARVPTTSARVLLSGLQRSYATPGRPRSAVGETSQTVKRAVKRTARSPAKAAGKKGSAAKKPAKKKAKKAAKKPAKKARKVLTPEQKTARAAAAEVDKIRELKKVALRGVPPRAHLSAINVFVKDRFPSAGSGPVSQKLSALVKEFPNLAPAEREHYNHLAQQQNASRNAEYKRWVESHPVATIARANNARKQLRRKLTTSNRKTTYKALDDERLVKGVVSPFMHFATERQASGDFQGIVNTDRLKLIGQEWKSLNAPEKQKYDDLFAKDRSRYEAEYTAVFGQAPPASRTASPP